ncbi:hypothetical protein DSUL_90045 [Desulfovibrionales bacterium]
MPDCIHISIQSGLALCTICLLFFPVGSFNLARGPVDYHRSGFIDVLDRELDIFMSIAIL